MPPPRVAVAVSGGRDSLALLHATHAAASPLGIAVHALHVHHGLQAAADAWVRVVADFCAERGLPCHVARLTGAPAAGDSIEAWARRERYRALASMAQAAGIGLVLLGHHRRDQSETFVLQALRGAGPAGLAAMPRQVVRDGITWARPWLDRPRASIEAYVAMQGLAPVDDPSNDDARHARNRLRRDVMPALSEAFPDAESALAAAAERAAEARAAIDEWAATDLAACRGGDGALQREAWLRLSPARRGFVLRAWLHGVSGRGASQVLVDRLMAEWPRTDVACWPAWAGWALRAFRGALVAEPVVPAAIVAPEEVMVDVAGGFGSYAVPSWHGTLVVGPAAGPGVPLARLRTLTLRPRSGGERFQAGPGRPPRSLKKQFQAAGVPAWSRVAPLVFDGDTLLLVPGLGLDARVVGGPGDGPLASLEWRADPPGDGGAAPGR